MNSLSSGWSPIRPRTPVDGGTGQRTVAVGAVHQAGEHRVVAHDERRDAEDLELLDAPLVLLADHLGRPPGIHLGQHGVGVDSGPGQRAVHDRPVAQVH